MKSLPSWSSQSNGQDGQEDLGHKTEEQGTFSNPGDKSLSLSQLQGSFGDKK